MGIKNKLIDSYINNSQEFAKPILKKIRELVHKACPDVEEKMKWSFPHFDYKNEMMCSMAGFKQHCTFGFWKASLMSDFKSGVTNVNTSAMGQLGQIKKLSDLPPDKDFISYIKEAMKLTDDGVKVKKAPANTFKAIETPDDLNKELKKNKAAMKTFENFSPSHKKEYVQWIIEARSAETRAKRLHQAIEWMSEGKIRNWKYAAK